MGLMAMLSRSTETDTSGRSDLVSAEELRRMYDIDEAQQRELFGAVNFPSAMYTTFGRHGTSRIHWSRTQVAQWERRASEALAWISRATLKDVDASDPDGELVFVPELLETFGITEQEFSQLRTLNFPQEAGRRLSTDPRTRGIRAVRMFWSREKVTEWQQRALRVLSFLN